VSVVTPSDRERFLHDGYLVVEGLVGKEHCDASIDAMASYVGIALDDPRSWYSHNLNAHGIVPLHHAQALWDLRQLPQVHEAFAAIYGDPRLWVTHDRVSFKAPPRPNEAPTPMTPVHWDCDPRTWKQISVQGVVYLRDTDPQQGAFCCVPSVYRGLGEWLATRNSDDEVRRPDVSAEPLVKVGGPAGSLVMFHRLMPHSSAPNETDRPRFVQYVGMGPEGSDEERAVRVHDYLHKMPPAWAIRQKVPGQQMPEPGAPARLTPLGRKLVGLDRW
jgi:hypothetical protein